MKSLDTKMFLAARSLCTKAFLDRYSIPCATSAQNLSSSKGHSACLSELRFNRDWWNSYESSQLHGHTFSYLSSSLGLHWLAAREQSWPMHVTHNFIQTTMTQTMLTGLPTVTTPSSLTTLGWWNWPLMAASWRNFTTSPCEAPGLSIFTATSNCTSFDACHSPLCTIPNCPAPSWVFILCTINIVFTLHIL